MSVTNTQMNNIVLEYFVQEGYQRAAETFAKENGIDLFVSQLGYHQIGVPFGNLDGDELADKVRDYLQKRISDSPHDNVDKTELIQPPFKIRKGYATIKQRKKIKNSILEGDITGAIQEIIDHFPTVLDSNNLLHFKLLKLNLIEMIRSHKLNPHITPDQERDFLDRVLLFVRENLINKVANSASLLKELEVTMSLLCFDFPVDGLETLPNELRSLLDISLRKDCWKLVNLVILNLGTSDLESRLTTLSTYPQFDFSNYQSVVLQSMPLLRSDGVDLSLHYLVDYDYSVPRSENQCISSGEKTPNDEADEAIEPDVVIPLVLESRLERLARFAVVTKQQLDW